LTLFDFTALITISDRRPKLTPYQGFYPSVLIHGDAILPGSILDADRESNRRAETHHFAISLVGSAADKRSIKLRRKTAVWSTITCTSYSKRGPDDLDSDRWAIGARY